MKHPDLSERQLEQLKLELVNKRNQFEEQLGLLAGEDSFAQADRTDGNAEDADEASEQVLHLETNLKEKRAETSLKQAEKALARMESGEYGLCEVCGKPIDLARLQAFPEATTCVEHSA